MSSSNVNRSCCATLHRVVHNPMFPIEYDCAMSEHRLTLTPNGFARMFYCPFCGQPLAHPDGRAPDTKVSQKELSEIDDIARDVVNMADLQSRIGEATIVIEMAGRAPDDRIMQHVYAGTWRTLHLYVHEQKDGTLLFTAIPVADPGMEGEENAKKRG